MSTTTIGSLSRAVLACLGERHEVNQIPLGPDAHFKSHGLAFTIRSFEVAGLCHLGVMEVTAPFGLIQVEGIILAPTHVLAPVMNVDAMAMPHITLLLSELYDMGGTPLAPEAAALLDEVKARYADLASDAPDERHWYDDFELPQTMRLESRDKVALAAAASDAVAGLICVLESAPAADEDEMRAASRRFAMGLLDSDGPATAMLTKAVGREGAERIIVGHLYGADSGTEGA